ncbi:pyridoxamine 5'-phosphate oxidase family protein [Corynebacterium liangguodongii]|uniref:Pyridoxine 5'-phosphate oxidase n=1 Tax=Corynebacterium liangguodongii TaxID=2079535 RepID=A0A2S0WEJ1_9CORY|nr:pyridoxamine 5'-phosphate oxidase family protein [Corynebacterium liangguodongii]AWB84188.1 pyridoxine 5'-phosphate oxidase [Corynebacterium liangguodongii]PWC00198.1 pyridoxamine 5'-phosphate oxidase family protein [Corynebacterium liangguodongii]
MDTTYEQLAYDEFVRRRQGSELMDIPEREGPFEFDPRHLSLIRKADFFFLGTVTGAGWPYVQHRGGPKGFVRQLGPTTLGWLEYSGNHQYVSTGNIDRDGRVAMFFVDFPTRTRLKVFGVARVVELQEDPELIERLRETDGGRINLVATHAFVVDVTATDQNCTKRIKPRWDKEQIDERIELYRADIRELKERISQLEEELASR